MNESKPSSNLHEANTEVQEIAVSPYGHLRLPQKVSQFP